MITRPTRRRGSLLVVLAALANAGSAPGQPAQRAQPAPAPVTSPAGTVEREAERTLREVDRLLEAGAEEKAAALVKDLVSRLEKSAAAQPRNARLQHLLGQALAYGGPDKSAAALTAFTRAAELDPKDGKSRLMAGALLTEAGKEAEALEWFKQAAAADPSYAMAHSNVGQLYQNQGKFQESLDAFRAAARLLPNDERPRAKVIQNLHALGRLKERDQEREALFKLHKEGKVDAPYYCREQFTVAKEKVMVFEYFQLKGDRAVRYAFNVLDETGLDVKYRVSFGSYPMTNAIARQTGEIGKDEQLFHLDGYYADGEHRTFRFFKKEPTYDEIRKLVGEVIEGKVPARSRFKPGEGGGEIEVPRPR